MFAHYALSVLSIACCNCYIACFFSSLSFLLSRYLCIYFFSSFPLSYSFSFSADLIHFDIFQLIFGASYAIIPLNVKSKVSSSAWGFLQSQFSPQYRDGRERSKKSARFLYRRMILIFYICQIYPAVHEQIFTLSLPVLF